MDKPNLFMSRREGYNFYNNMVCLAKAVENHYTTIDLHNEECVTGKVTSVDGFMNVELENAVFYNARGQEIPFKTFFAKARSIRYIHVPEEIPIIESIKNLVMGKKPIKETKKRTYKEIRAERRHKETLEHLQKKQ